MNTVFTWVNTIAIRKQNNCLYRTTFRDTLINKKYDNNERGER